MFAFGYPPLTASSLWYHLYHDIGPCALFDHPPCEFSLSHSYRGTGVSGACLKSG